MEVSAKKVLLILPIIKIILKIIMFYLNYYAHLVLTGKYSLVIKISINLLFYILFINTYNQIECTPGVRPEDMLWMGKKHELIEKALNNRRGSIDYYARYVADPESNIIKFMQNLENHSDFCDQRTNEGKATVALIDYVYKAIQNKDLLKQLEKQNELLNQQLIDAQNMANQYQLEHEEKENSIASGSTAVADEENAQPQNDDECFVTCERGCALLYNIIQNTQGIVIIVLACAFIVSTGVNVYQAFECI